LLEVREAEVLLEQTVGRARGGRRAEHLVHVGGELKVLEHLRYPRLVDGRLGVLEVPCSTARAPRRKRSPGSGLRWRGRGGAVSTAEPLEGGVQRVVVLHARLLHRLPLGALHEREKLVEAQPGRAVAEALPPGLA